MSETNVKHSMDCKENKKEQSEIADPRQHLFCAANKWEDVLNERSLIANESSKWSSCKCVKVKGLKSCNGLKV